MDELKRALLAFLWLCISAGAAGAADFDVSRYALSLTPDFKTRTISGVEHIRLKTTRDGVKDLVFSNNNLAIDSVLIDREYARAEHRQDGLVVTLPEPLPRNRTVTLQVLFHGAPLRGLIFGEKSVHTEYFTCDWMICPLDEPGDKAAFDLELHLPATMTSVGNGRLVRTRRTPEFLIAHEWRETRPYSPYLFGFAAGALNNFVEKRRGVELAAISETEDAAALQRAFAPTGEMLAFFQERAGVPFPHKRFTQILVAGSAAQEGVNFSVLGTDEIDVMLKDPQEDWAIAHELAHQYWGNLITCTTWRDFWLNEGVTVFMTAAWKEHKWGRAAYDREMELARTRLSAARDAGFDKPLTFAGPYPSLRIRRAVQYSKGALFMDALRRELGEQAFWAALRAYTRAHAGGVVTTRDFQRAFETSSRRDLSALFNAWAY